MEAFHLCMSIFLFAVAAPPQVINNNGSAEFLLSTNHTFTVSPEFIGSRLLLKMRKMAERQLGVLVEKAVISVPADFDERQRNYTVKAAQLAGQFFFFWSSFSKFFFFSCYYTRLSCPLKVCLAKARLHIEPKQSFAP